MYLALFFFFRSLLIESVWWTPLLYFFHMLTLVLSSSTLTALTTYAFKDICNKYWRQCALLCQLRTVEPPNKNPLLGEKLNFSISLRRSICHARTALQNVYLLGIVGSRLFQSGHIQVVERGNINLLVHTARNVYSSSVFLLYENRSSLFD